MKKFLSRPGFEAIFYAGLIAVFILPAMVFAQSNTKSVNITVFNNDTLINGKKISELKPAEKQEAKEALATLGAQRKPGADFVFRLGNDLRNDSARTNLPNTRHRVNGIRLNPLTLTADSNHWTTYYRDSLGKGPRVYTLDRMPTVRPDMKAYRMPNAYVDLEGFRMPIARPGERGNVVTLDFNSIDKNGIPTRSNFRISSAMPDMVKKLAGTETANLLILDVALVPEFSAGKTLLVFTLPYTTQADVSFTDSDGKALWSEKSTGNKFNKSFALPMNGVYYLVVKQGGKAAVRKVVKE